MRAVMLLLLCWASLSAMYYSTLQLNAETIIYPKLMLLKKAPESLLIDGRIRFCIVYEPQDRAVATQIQTRLQELYPGSIEGYPFEVTMVQYSQIGTGTRASAMLMLYSDTLIEQATAYAKHHGIMTFAYDPSYLEKGVLFALKIERTTRIYLNRRALAEYGIAFSDALYQIVRFVDENAESSFASQ